MAVISSVVGWQAVAGAHTAERPQSQGELRERAPHGRDFGNPRVARMHQLMVRDNAGMARMHEEMMGPG